MVDFPYQPNDVDDHQRPIFEQLRSEFPEPCEIWRRVEDFGRRKAAAVVNRATGTAAIIVLQTGLRLRTKRLSADELARIRGHLLSNSAADLEL
jgi:hypothetical protein